MFWKKRKKAELLTLSNIDEYKDNNNLLYIFFQAPWCSSCKILTPILNDLAHEYREKKVCIAIVNTDKEKALAQQYGIRSLPTLVIYDHAREVYRGSGMIPKLRLKEHIDNQLKKQA
jgi:thioredoxin